MSIDENKLIEDFAMLIRLPLPELKRSLFHKAEELKHEYGHQLKKYRAIETMIDPDKKENTGEHVKEIRFELLKKKSGWKVKPVGLPIEVVNHITTMKISPGIIKMQKFKLPGRNIDLSFEKIDRDFIIGSLKEKIKEKTAKDKNSAPEQSRKTGDKTGDIKTLLTYLLNNEFLYNVINDDFLEKWKPLIDQGIINNKVIES